MAQNSIWTPWTISDGLLTTLADQWLAGFEINDSFVHADRLVRLGFKPSSSYCFVNDLVNRRYAIPKSNVHRPLKPYISPTHNGVNEIKISVNQEMERLKTLEKKLGTKLTIQLQRLEILGKAFDKIDAFLL